MEEGTLDPQATLGGEPEPTPEPEPEPEPVAAQEHAEYVVQTLRVDTDDTWVDIATVRVPSRTRRRSVLEKALEQAPDAKPTVAMPAAYRVLDAQSFEAIPARMEPPEPSDPVLRIG